MKVELINIIYISKFVYLFNIKFPNFKEISQNVTQVFCKLIPKDISGD